MAEKQTPIIIQVQKFLSNKWKFRYNEVLGRTEFLPKDKAQNGYQILTDYDLNSIYLLLAENDYHFSNDSLRKLLKSKFVDRYNPFHEYFNSLPEWDGTTDYIEMLASTVDTTNNDFFKITFKKWLVAMVASLIDDNVINHTFLIFTGGQGVGKTTWINNLVPERLREYYYAGAINPNHPDSKIQLAENMLVNVDELQGLTPKGIEDLKALVTIRDIKVRRPYASIHESLPHRASFAGSVNSTDFLSDTTGNRRFLCFEVESIDYEHNIPIDNVLSQALFLFRNGFRFYLNKEEILQLNVHNEAFVRRSLMEDILIKWCVPCEEDDSSALFGSTTEILSALNLMDAKIRVDDRNLQKLGKALKKHQYQRVKRRGVYVYAYKIIIEEEGYGYGV